MSKFNFRSWFKERKNKQKLDTFVFISKNGDGRDLFQYDYKDAEGKLISLVLLHIYTDAKGTKYYQFVNPLQMTQERCIAANVAAKEFSYNMTVEQLTAICDDILKANNARDYNTIAMKAMEIKTRAIKLVEYETSIKLAAIYFLIEGEHPGRYNPLLTTKKVDNWKADDEARGFFLQLIWDTVKPYSELSGADLLDCLTAMDYKAQKKVEGQQETIKPASTAKTAMKNTGSYNIPKW